MLELKYENVTYLSFYKTNKQHTFDGILLGSEA